MSDASVGFEKIWDKLSGSIHDLADKQIAKEFFLEGYFDGYRGSVSDCNARKEKV